MKRVDQLISAFLRQQYGIQLAKVYSKLRATLLEDTEKVPCNLCGRDDCVEIAQRDKYDLAVTSVICRNCGLIYLNPRPTIKSYDRFYVEGGSREGVYHVSLGLNNIEELLQRYYGPTFRMSDEDAAELRNFARTKFSEFIGKDASDVGDDEVLQALETKAREFEAWRYDAYAQDIYRHFGEFVPRQGKVFEIGASWGKLLMPWRDQHACEVTGLEPRKATVQAARDRLGIELFQGFPATANVPENAYDAVLIIRTINHMLDPLGDLRHAWRWLKPGGMLIIDNSDAVREARYEGFENNVAEIDHAYMFSSNTLGAMVQKAGFEIVRNDVVDTRHVFWGGEREPQPKQIRIAARKSLQPVEVAWPDPLSELATLLRHELSRGRELRLRDSKRKAKTSGKPVERDARTGTAKVWSLLTRSKEQPKRLRK
jgi:ubiquinone/menaquinone biosynthesis C-methylase UbiE